MTDNSKIAKNSLILYIKFFIVAILGLLFSRIILDALGASNYGLYSVIGGIVSLMAFLNTMMATTTRRYIAFELGTNNMKNINAIINICWTIHIIIAILIGLIVETVGVFYIYNFLNVEKNQIGDAIYILHFSVLSIIFYVISVPFEGLITAEENFFIISLLDVLKKLLVLIVAILLLYYGGNRLRLYAILVAGLSGFNFLLVFLYSKFKYPTVIKWKFVKSKKKYNEILSFSGWIMFGVAARTGEQQGSAMLINSFFGTLLNASFGIASKINEIVKMFSDGLVSAIVPQITKSFSKGNTERTIQLVIYSSKYAFFLMLLPSIPILLETDFLLQIWLKNVPEYTAIFIQLMIVQGLIVASSSGIPPAIHATGKIKYFQLILNGISLLGLPLTYILFSLGYPSYMLLYGYILIDIIKLFVRQYMLKRNIQFDTKTFFTKAYLKMILVIIAVSPLFAIRYFFDPGFLRFILMITISVIWLLTIIYFWGLEKLERRTINIKIMNQLNINQK